MQRRRPLCPTTSESLVGSSSFSTITSGYNMDVLRFSNTFFKDNDSIQITEYWNYSTNCSTSEIEEKLSHNYRNFNQTMHVPIEEFKDKCNLFKISQARDNADTRTDGFQYPLINDDNSECECEEYYYEPSAITNCTCKATDEICNAHDVTPWLQVSAMRTNPYYISVSN